MNRLRLTVAQNRGFVGACLLLAALYLAYNILHPRGFSAAVFVQNANEAVALGFVAMAQTVPVLLGGLDLSVGAVMTLSTASPPSSSPARRRRSSSACSRRSLPARLRPDQRPDRRLRPHPADHRDAGDRRDLHRPRAHHPPEPGGEVDGDLSWAMTNPLSDFADTYGWPTAARPWFHPFAGIPVPLVILVVVAFARLGAVPPLGDRPHRLRHRLGRGRRLHVGPADRPREARRLHPRRLLRRLGGLYLAIQTRRATPTSPRPAPTPSTPSPRS